MSFFEKLSKRFEKQMKVPVVTDLGNKFQTFGNENLDFQYGDGITLNTTSPKINYSTLFSRVYYMYGIYGENEDDFIKEEQVILSLSAECFLDSLNRIVMNDDPVKEELLTDADELYEVCENMSLYNYDSCYVCYGDDLMEFHKSRRNGFFKDRQGINKPLRKDPYG